MHKYAYYITLVKYNILLIRLLIISTLTSLLERKVMKNYKKISYFFALCAVFGVVTSPAVANGLAENNSWQFQSTAEAANRAFIEEMRMKRASGFYNTPQYNTFIDTQNNFNCSNSASSAGNGGSRLRTY